MTRFLPVLLVFVSGSLAPLAEAASLRGFVPAPGAVESPVFRLTSSGAPVFVERFFDTSGPESYARFTLEAPAELRIEVGSRVVGVRGVPDALAARARIEGNAIVLPMEEARPSVLFLQTERGYLEKLFLLPDAPEKDVPDTSRPGVLDARAIGADATGSALETKRLQGALDSLGRRGGGVLHLPRGIYRTGTLSIPSNVTLHLAEGSVLKGSREPADYPKDVFPDGRGERGSDTSIVDADARFVGEFMTFSRLLLVGEAANVAIRGRGTIDGDGSHLRGVRNAVPNMLRVRRSRNVRVEDVLFRDAAAWSLHLLGSTDVTMRNVKILNDRGTLNTDGIDVDASSRVTIENPFIFTKDDGVCLKATNNSDVLADVRDVTVRGGLVSSRDAALKLGTESQSALFENVTFEDVDVFDSHRAFSVVVRDGATYRNVTYRGIRVNVGVEHLFEQVVGVRRGRDKVLGRIEGLRFEDIEAPYFRPPSSNWTWYAQYRPNAPRPGQQGVPTFQGADAFHALTGLVFRNVRVRGERLTPENARGLAGLVVGPNVTGEGGGAVRLE